MHLKTIQDLNLRLGIQTWVHTWDVPFFESFFFEFQSAACYKKGFKNGTSQQMFGPSYLDEQKCEGNHQNLQIFKVIFIVLKCTYDWMHNLKSKYWTDSKLVCTPF